MNWKGWATTGGYIFLGGLSTSAATYLHDAGPPSTSTQWKAFAMGAVIGGIISVGNWLRKSPLPSGPVNPEQRL